jgi:soluble lytic murein transglycosylase-like protein
VPGAFHVQQQQLGKRVNKQVFVWAAWMTLAAMTGSPVQASQYQACYERASIKYGLPAGLLRAVAKVESAERPGAENLTHQSRTKTTDVGLMQINTSWLPTLARYGIDAKKLQEPCVNVDVGAWILAHEIRRRGNQWEAVGAYNAACNQLKGKQCQMARQSYAWKVYRHLARMNAQELGKGPQ